MLTLVCEEDGTEVDSDEFLITLPDNTIFMALKPEEIWKPHPVCMCVYVKQKQYLFRLELLVALRCFTTNFINIRKVVICTTFILITLHTKKQKTQ